MADSQVGAIDGILAAQPGQQYHGQSDSARGSRHTTHADEVLLLRENLDAKDALIEAQRIEIAALRERVMALEAHHRSCTVTHSSPDRAFL
jgi:hypothetical protein